MLIDMVSIDRNKVDEQKFADDMEVDLLKNREKPIYLKAGEDPLDFLLKQRDAKANVTICPRCNLVFAE